MDNPFSAIGPQPQQEKTKGDVLVNPFSAIGTAPSETKIQNPFNDIGPSTEKFSISDKAPYYEGLQLNRSTQAGPMSTVGPGTIDGNASWFDNFSYGFKLGISDTYRGIKQMAGSDLENLRQEQQDLYARMQAEDGIWTTIGYFGGALLDPVTWLIPFAKAKTIYSMAKMGAVSGGLVGALGYVDEESILNTRTKQAGAGILGGAIIAPAIGSLGKLLGKKTPGGLYPEADVNVKTLNDSAFTTSRLQGAMGERYRQVRVRTDKDIQFTERELVRDLPNKYILNPVRLFFNNTFVKPYQEYIGKPGFEYLSTGKFGPDIATGAVGAFLGPQYLEEDATAMQKFSAASIGFLAGFTGVGIAKRVPVKRTFLAGTKDEYTKTVPLSELIARGIQDNYGLPKDATAIKAKALGKQNEIAGRFTELAEKAMQLTTDERKLLLNLMEGDIKYGPVKIKKLSDQFRKEVKTLGQMFVDFGLLNKETVQRNINRYLRRTYLKDPKLAQIGDELKPRGIIIEVSKGEYLKRFKNDKAYYIGAGSDAKAIKKIQKIRFETPEKINSPEYKALEKQIKKDSKIQGHVGWELFDIDSKKFAKLKGNDGVKIRWELTKQERIALGEIEDGALAISETGRILSGQLGRSFFYSELSKANYVYTKPTAADIGKFNLKQIPNVIIQNTAGKKRFGPLAGKWVPEEVYDNLIRTDNYLSKTPNEFYKQYKKLNSLWKVSKTAFNPTVHINNTLSNVVLYDLMDGSRFSENIMAAGKAMLQAGKGKKSELFDLAQKYGVLEADFVSNELKNITKVLKSNPYSVFANGKQDPFNNAVSAAGIIFNDLKRSAFGLKSGAKFATDLYRAEDTVFRIALFRDRLAKGFSPVDAALDARRGFVDYDINAPVINFLRESATPFLAYTYRIVPLLAETAVVRPWKYAKWAALGYGLNALGGYYSGGDEAEERALMSEMESGRIMGIPFLPHRNIKLPIPQGVFQKPEDAEQKSYYVDVTRYVPGGDVLDLNNLGPIPGLPAPIQPSFGLLGDIIPPLFGYDLFQREKLKGLGVSTTDDMKIRFGKAVSNLMPNFPFAPGSYTTQNIERARKQISESPFRAPETELGALARGLGFKVKEADIEKLSASKALELKKKITGIREQMAVEYSKFTKGSITEDELQDTLEKKAERIGRIANIYGVKFETIGKKIEPKALIPGLLALPGELGIPGLSISDQTKNLFIK